MTERRWVHCPCGKRLVLPELPIGALVVDCPRCGRRCSITLSSDDSLTIVAAWDRIIQTKEAG